MLGARLATAPFWYFSGMDRSQVQTKDLRIPAGDIDLNACLYLPKYALDEHGEPREQLPLIILHSGWLVAIKHTVLRQWAIPLALGGPFAVLVYDYRGVGESPGPRLMRPEILEDVPTVIDYAAGLPDVDPTRMGFLGISFGAVAALTKAYADERVKAIVSIVGLHDPKENFERKAKDPGEWIALRALHASGVKAEKFTEDEMRQVSPAFCLQPDCPDLNSRVFLMNVINDKAIDFASFAKNQEILKLPPEQTLVLQKGGHSGSQQELIIAARVLQFLHEKLG